MNELTDPNKPAITKTDALPKPIVLVSEHGRWLITHDSAMTELNSFVQNANRLYYALFG